MDTALGLAELQVLTENFIKKSTDTLADTEQKVLIMLKVYGECSPSILINKVGILKTNLALVLKKLLASGLVQNRKNTQDRRSKLYSLTQRGNQRIDLILEAVQHQLKDIQTEDFYYAIKIVASVLNKKL